MDTKPEVRERPPVVADTPPPTRVPAIEFEDRTDAAAQQAVLEVLAAWQWVQTERAAGRQPN